MANFRGEARDGKSAAMTPDEVKMVVKDFTAIVTDKKKGAIFMMEDITSPTEKAAGETNIKITMYGNGVDINQVHKSFHDVMPSRADSSDEKPDVKVFKGSVNDLMEMLKKDIEKSKRERGDQHQ